MVAQGYSDRFILAVIFQELDKVQAGGELSLNIYFFDKIEEIMNGSIVEEFSHDEQFKTLTTQKIRSFQVLIDKRKEFNKKKFQFFEKQQINFRFVKSVLTLLKALKNENQQKLIDSLLVILKTKESKNEKNGATLLIIIQELNQVFRKNVRIVENAKQKYSEEQILPKRQQLINYVSSL